MDKMLEKYRGAMMGLAVGDALGVPAEFKSRGTFPKITEMIGGGPFNLKPGEWTDDTSMALCLGKSLIENDGFDAKDQMDKYWQWIEDGYMSSNGKMFDIGDTTSDALCRYRKTGNPIAGIDDIKCAGNGSLMRLAPIPLFYKYDDQGFLLQYARQSSATTHGSTNCIDSCALLSLSIYFALQGIPKEYLLDRLYTEPPTFITSKEVIDIAKGAYKNKTEDQIKSSGYVIHTLEAALWSFYTTDTFEDGCIKAVNLGDDADTVGAVYGQLAGAYYGIDSIPKRWVDKIVLPNLIIEIADGLFHNGKNNI
jgi:ADP-ribosyl-[dinitrogen reductase] hydrolase